jgi:filamentous hemagglutinin
MAGQATQDVDAAFKHTEKGFLSKKTITETAQLHNTAAVGSSLDGGAVNVQAGRDVTIKGSSIIADKDLSIDAKRNLSVLSVEEMSNSSSSKEVKKSGLTGGLSSGNLSVGSIIVRYTIDGETTTVKFPNEANQIPGVTKP